MRCPKCNSENIRCFDSRATGTNSVRRRRKCLDCEYRWTTYEISEIEKAQYEKTRRQNANMIASIKRLAKSYGGYKT